MPLHEGEAFIFHFRVFSTLTISIHYFYFLNGNNCGEGSNLGKKPNVI